MIDGRPARVSEGSTLLDAARSVRVDVPTLCHHDSLEPHGACRLCMVEVRDPATGWHKLVASCLYPAADGLEVHTRSSEALLSRRVALQLLLARSPGSERLRTLAEELDLPPTPFVPLEGGDDCVLCGLCVRVCEAHSTSAISTLQRGVLKVVGHPGGPEGEAPDCVGCGACAELCPTGCIPWTRSGPERHIWGRRFPVPVAQVDVARCRACGACAQACPFSVARVRRFRGGAVVASIDPEHCRGCGLCAPACPTGAIQPLASLALPERDVAVAPPQPWGLLLRCPRSPRPDADDPAATERLVERELPCVGGVTAGQLLEALAAGASSVVVMGRDQATCPHAPGDDRAADTVASVARIARFLGLGAHVPRFVLPAAGPDGPAAIRRALRDELRQKAPSPLAAAPAPDLGDRTGLERTLGIGRAALEQPGLRADATRWLSELPFPAPAGAVELVCGSELPLLDLVLEGRIAGWRPADLLLAASRGIAGLQGGAPRVRVLPQGVVADDGSVTRLALTSADLHAAGVGARTVDSWLARAAFAAASPVPGLCVAVDLSEGLPPELAALLGQRLRARVLPLARPADGGPSIPRRLDLGASARRALEGRLLDAEARGARWVVSSDPVRLAQLRLLMRPGSWRRLSLQPVSLAELLLALGVVADEEVRP